MTEAEWLGGTDPVPMQQYLDGKVSDRIGRLYRCACCRIIWSALIDSRSRSAVEVAERYADGLATSRERAAAHAFAEMVHQEWSGVYDVTYCPIMATEPKTTKMVWVAETAANHAVGDLGEYCVLLRDIFGNPFRPVAFDAAWLTSTVVALAMQMYGSRDFAHMPILADALQDAGCDNDDVLAHCRDEKATHVRGCWVVDLVLGKE